MPVLVLQKENETYRDADDETIMLYPLLVGQCKYQLTLSLLKDEVDSCVGEQLSPSLVSLVQVSRTLSWTLSRTLSWSLIQVVARAAKLYAFSCFDA